MNLFVTLLFVLATNTDAAKLLLLPIHHGAHIKLLANIGSILQDHGHEVYMVVSETYASFATEFDITPITPTLTTEISFTEQLLVHEKVENSFVFFHKGIALMRQHVRDIMADNQVMEELNRIQFDLVLLDAAELNFPSYLIPYKLSIPYISVCTRPDPWLARVPTLPSVEGAFAFMLMTEDSNLLHRLANTLLYLTYQLLQPRSLLSPLNDDTMFTDLVPEKENIGLNELFIRSEMFLVNSNIYCMDETRASAPHYQYIPAIGANEAKPLPAELEEIFQNATHGVILLAFGSTYTELPQKMLCKLVLAFSQIKYSVIIRHTGDRSECNTSKNIYIRPWVPQNDILGHPKTKLFVTHMGNNGQIEAVYHGVPMLMMPHCCDQFINAQKAEKRGYGKILDRLDFTAEQFKDIANELIQNTGFLNNTRKCSRIIRSLPRARDTIPFWVDHILEFGGSHLKPYYINMPLWKFLNLDIVIVILLLVQIVFCGLLWCCSKGKCPKQKHQKTD